MLESSAAALVVEDDHQIAEVLKFMLERDGYAVRLAPDGRSAQQLIGSSPAPTMVILDLMLPGFDGFRVLRTLRAEGIETPILILTAKGEEEDKVKGFRLGADDYVTKPFGAMELVARVDALTRRPRLVRPRSGTAGPVDRFGDVEVHRGSRIVARGGEPVALTPKEYDLLVALINRGGAVTNDASPDIPALQRLPRVSGITVNTVHGRDASIADAARRFAPQVESMEGAAFMYACAIAAIPYAQVRAVSNVVERRNRSAWQIGPAVTALSAAALAILESA